MVGWLSVNGTRYPCRLTRVSTLGGEYRPIGLDITHTASIPVTGVDRNSVVQDNRGISYRVLSVDVILNKTRLGLKSQG